MNERYVICCMTDSEAMVRNVGGHQTHAVVIAAGCGEMTHCGPLILLRVVQEYLVFIYIGVTKVVSTITATCRASVADYDCTILSSTHPL